MGWEKAGAGGAGGTEEVDEMEVGGGAEMSVNDTSGQRQRNRLVCIKKYLMDT